MALMNKVSRKVLKWFLKSCPNSLIDLGPLYHNYSFFGFNSVQCKGIFEKNQKAKEPIIIAYIAYAIAKSKTNLHDKTSFCELFCADGYYAMIARRLGCNPSIGIDNNQQGFLDKSHIIADRLGLDNVKFIKADITSYSGFPCTDIVANLGGLYHVDSPEEILRMSYNMANRYLIVQSVVSLATDNENYFESPAPGWTWGNRYSRKSFDRMIRKICRKIVDSHFNELVGNDRLEDRGSVYYLIEK